MTITQQVITIGMCVLGTVLTRALPFLIFNGKRPTPRYVQYLGKVLPSAIFSMLVVYCLRNVTPLHYSYGLPELIAIGVTVTVHLWKRGCKKSPQEKRLRSCQKARQQSFFVV